MSVIQNNTISTNSITEATSANGVSVDGLKLKDYSLMYGSNIGLTLDSNGSLTFPNKIWVGPTSTHTSFTTDNSALPFNEKNYGSTLGKAAFNTTTYKFTAPVAGEYLSIYTGMVNNDSDLNGTSGLQINNSTFGAILYSSTFSNHHNNFSHSQVLTLAVNDTLHWQNFSLNQYINRGYAQWLIIFLG